MFRRLFLGFVILSVSFSTAWAAALTTNQKTQLTALVVALNKASQESDIERIAQVIPVRLYQEIARRLQTTPEVLEKKFQQELRKQLANFGPFYLDPIHITYEQTETGTPYALVSAHIETPKTAVDYKILAFIEDNQWRLVFGGKQTLANPIFVEIYPGFSHVLLPQEIIKRK